MSYKGRGGWWGGEGGKSRAPQSGPNSHKHAAHGRNCECCVCLCACVRAHVFVLLAYSPGPTGFLSAGSSGPTGPHASRASHGCLAWRLLACGSQGFTGLLLSEERNAIVLMSSIKRFQREKQPADAMTRRSTRILRALIPFVFSAVLFFSPRCLSGFFFAYVDQGGFPASGCPPLVSTGSRPTHVHNCN